MSLLNAKSELRFAEIFAAAIKRAGLSRVSARDRRLFALGALAMIEEQEAMVVQTNADDDLVLKEDRQETLSERIEDLYAVVRASANAN